MFENLRVPALYDLPIMAVGFGFFLMLLGALEVGYRAGLLKRKQLSDAEAGGGGVVLTSMFALLGLIVAFTYGFTVNRYSDRTQAALGEANALGTAFLRAGLIEGADGAALRSAILDYARTRVVSDEEWGTRAGAMAVLKRTAEAQAALWPLVERIVTSRPAGAIEATLVVAVNDVIDRDTIRVAASVNRLPPPIMGMLFVIGAMSIGVAGFNAGFSGFISRLRMTAMTLSLVGVMVVIVDFDRPRRGLIRVTQEPLVAQIADMEAVMVSAGAKQ